MNVYRNMQKLKNKHGGARKGSGAKKKPDHLKKEATKVMRIRISKVEEVEKINKS